MHLLIVKGRGSVDSCDATRSSGRDCCEVECLAGRPRGQISWHLRHSTTSSFELYLTLLELSIKAAYLVMLQDISTGSTVMPVLTQIIPFRTGALK